VSITPWWRSAVVYEAYIRSFADGNGDGLGDIPGLRSRLPYLADVGVDAIWITPWYPSPMADAGYDVADYRSIDPRFGTLAEARALLTDAHDLGIRVLLDIVPNHTSDQHPWFVAAVRAGRGSPERARYLFREGRGRGGSRPPNNWVSVFGGSAWTRVRERDGKPGEWYLHLFAPEQPDLDWSQPDVRTDFETTLRFWFDLGLDGFRIDVAHSLIKAGGLPDIPADMQDGVSGRPAGHPHWDRDEVHDLYRRWRSIGNSYDEPRIFVAEAWVDEPERLARYVRRDELHTAFNFEFLQTAWLAPPLRNTIERTLTEHARVGAPPTWVLSNHDVVRSVSRYAREQTGDRMIFLENLLGKPADATLGLRRARAAALLMLALPGGAYIYQGEELGLQEVEDLPTEALTDPTWERSGRTRRGRDGCRVPLPWDGDRPPYGFGAGPGHPWLPQPDTWAEHTVAAQRDQPDSTLSLYREALRIRHLHPALGDGSLRWLPAPDGALAFAREPRFRCYVNVSAAPLALPVKSTVLLASGPLDAARMLPPDTAVWVDQAA